MEFQHLSTVLAILTAAIGIPLAAWRPFKEHQDWTGNRSKQMREQFEFADKLMNRIFDGQVDPYSKELALYALAGTKHIAAAEIEYVINLRKSPRDLRAYIGGRRFLDSDRVVSHRELAFRDRYKSRSIRKWCKRIYFSLYMLCFVTAFGPWLLPQLTRQPNSLEELLIASLLLLPLAIMFGKESIDIGRAETLMEAAVQPGAEPTLLSNPETLGQHAN